MDRSYYASIEVGRRNVSLSNLKKIADGFHITISELMHGVEEVIFTWLTHSCLICLVN